MYSWGYISVIYKLFIYSVINKHLFILSLYITFYIKPLHIRDIKFISAYIWQNANLITSHFHMFYQISYLIVKSFDEVLGIKYVTLVLLM